MAIGKLEEVDIRELWKHEQYDFSEWLAKKENVENLNDILGLTVVDISKETYVGSYRWIYLQEMKQLEQKLLLKIN